LSLQVYKLQVYKFTSLNLNKSEVFNHPMWYERSLPGW